MCHMSHVRYHVSDYRCYMSDVMCHVSDVGSIFFKDKVVELVGGGSVINGAYPV